MYSIRVSLPVRKSPAQANTHHIISTGMGCLPATKIPEAKGHVLHDWHAEILALRAFNHFLLQDCSQLARSSEHHSKILQWRDPYGHAIPYDQPFSVRDNVRFHMYCSEAPCGDASMEIVMEGQKDASPWPVNDCHDNEQPSAMLGRGNFSELGVVRRKPGNEIEVLSV